ncbi:MAG: hypothetical protein NTY16_06745 [Deltaproteobacteria bacterium]|nr:hypothetical protein [Deltaproteobacteria bacterium]
MNKSKKTRKTSPDQRSSKPARSAGTGSGSKDIKILETAKEKAKQLVQKNPSAANLTAYERASKMVAQALTTAAPAGDETSFKNRMDALRYLQERGLKVKQSKLYRDCDLGLCRVEKNGVVTKASIENYIQHPQSNLESGNS